MQVSIDHVGNKAEYIRKDLRWESFEENLLNLKQMLPKAKVVAHPTISVLNVADWKEIEHYLTKNFHETELNFLTRPNYFCIQNLSLKHKNEIIGILGIKGKVKGSKPQMGLIENGTQIWYF